MYNQILAAYYRPQRSCGQGYVFTRVCDSVNGGVSEEPPRDQADPPRRENPPPGDQADTPGTRQTPPGRTPPGPGRPPWDQADPPGRTPPWKGEPPPREEDCSIWSMSGRYASYWNAFLFLFIMDDEHYSSLPLTDNHDNCAKLKWTFNHNL